MSPVFNGNVYDFSALQLPSPVIDDDAVELTLHGKWFFDLIEPHGIAGTQAILFTFTREWIFASSDTEDNKIGVRSLFNPVYATNYAMSYNKVTFSVFTSVLWKIASQNKKNFLTIKIDSQFKKMEIRVEFVETDHETDRMIYTLYPVINSIDLNTDTCPPEHFKTVVVHDFVKKIKSIFMKKEAEAKLVLDTEQQILELYSSLTQAFTAVSRSKVETLASLLKVDNDPNAEKQVLEEYDLLHETPDELELDQWFLECLDEHENMDEKNLESSRTPVAWKVFERSITSKEQVFVQETKSLLLQISKVLSTFDVNSMKLPLDLKKLVWTCYWKHPYCFTKNMLEGDKVVKPSSYLSVSLSTSQMKFLKSLSSANYCLLSFSTSGYLRIDYMIFEQAVSTHSSLTIIPDILRTDGVVIHHLLLRF